MRAALPSTLTLANSTHEVCKQESTPGQQYTPPRFTGAPGAGEEHPACCSPDLSTQDTRLCTLRGLLQIQGVQGVLQVLHPHQAAVRTATGYCNAQSPKQV